MSPLKRDICSSFLWAIIKEKKSIRVVLELDGFFSYMFHRFFSKFSVDKCYIVCKRNEICLHIALSAVKWLS